MKRQSEIVARVLRQWDTDKLKDSLVSSFEISGTGSWFELALDDLSHRIPPQEFSRFCDTL